MGMGSEKTVGTVEGRGGYVTWRRRDTKFGVGKGRQQRGMSHHRRQRKSLGCIISRSDQRTGCLLRRFLSLCDPRPERRTQIAQARDDERTGCGRQPASEP